MQQTGEPRHILRCFDGQHALEQLGQSAMRHMLIPALKVAVREPMLRACPSCEAKQLFCNTWSFLAEAR